MFVEAPSSVFPNLILALFLMVMWHKIHGCVKRSLWCVRWVQSYSVGGGRSSKRSRRRCRCGRIGCVLRSHSSLRSGTLMWWVWSGEAMRDVLSDQIRYVGPRFPTVCGCRCWGVTLRWTTSTHVKWNAHWGSKHHAALRVFFSLGVRGDRVPITSFPHWYF